MLSKTIILTLILFLSSNHVSENLVIVGRLTRMSHSPDCGGLYFGVLAEYDSIKVIQGTFDAKSVFVIHGCPELSRKEFAKGSGNLHTFRIGDHHHLELVRNNIYKIGNVIDVDTTGKIMHPDSLTYFAKTVDLVMENTDSIMTK